MEKPPIDPDVELFQWGPAPMREFFPDNWYEGIWIKSPKHYPDDAWPTGLLLARDKKIVFVGEFPVLRIQGSGAFLRHILPKKAREELVKKYNRELGNIHRWEERIEQTNFHQVSDEDFLKIWKDFHVALDDYWIYAVIPEIANYGGDGVLERELRKYIKDDTAVIKALEILAAPENPSFFQQEGIDLAETKDLESHARAYQWIQNSYNGVKESLISFFEERKKKLPSDIRAKFEARRLEIQKRKKNFQKESQLPQEVIEMADALVWGIEWQDERKKEIFKYITYKDILATELARRFKKNKDDLLNFNYIEILDILLGKISDKDIIERRAGFGHVVKPGSVELLDVETTKKYWDIYIGQKVDTGIKELKGVVASNGKGEGVVSGRAYIVHDPHNEVNFPEGSILVAPMTTPEYIFIMKQASAIVTDAGGLTSHAAIVSRELGIPCIVGTKIATKALKEGDKIEVDANTGIVRKL